MVTLTVSALSLNPIGMGTSEIYVMAADGENPRRFTNNPHGDYRSRMGELSFFGFSRRQKVYCVGLAQTG